MQNVLNAESQTVSESQQWLPVSQRMTVGTDVLFCLRNCSSEFAALVAGDKLFQARTGASANIGTESVKDWHY